MSKIIKIGLNLIMLTVLMLVINITVLANTNNLYLHYYRFDGSYANWDAWVWQYEPVGLDGAGYELVDDETASEYNFGGKVVVIDLDEYFPEATTLGIIMRKTDWSAKDVDADRFIDISSGDRHFYFVQGEQSIGTTPNDPNGPSRYNKFQTSQFVADNKINLTATAAMSEIGLKLYKNTIEITNEINNITFTNSNKTATIILENNLDYQATYEIEFDFKDQEISSKKIVDFTGMYDTTSFNNVFYTDEDLGAIYTKQATTFRLWAPLASDVKINIYETGTPANLLGSNEKMVYDLIRKDNGVYEIVLTGDYHGKYYTYDVLNGTNLAKDIVDPYAKGVGINGLRGLVVDFTKTNPTGWDLFSKPNNIINKTDSIIYELHVRDLTTHSSWNGTDENRGKYLGLIEEGTTYNNLTTGFDHIKDLGITHVQLLPVFDYGNAIDETRQDDENYNSFNWGYMPLNFNALEGNYSKDPYDGLSRITEFKEVVMGYGNANIRINMDVVYNHTGQSADSNFHLIVPGYYHRFTDGGAFSNGSGTGNETASERSMVQKFIVDSVLFWAEEYNLGGFRFDLMALHDIDTMNMLSEKLHELDPKILVYGEPWMGGTSTLPSKKQAGKEKLKDLNNIGAFNDDTRDGIKGSVFSSWMGGYLQGDFTQENKVKYGITGGVSHQDNPNYNVWHSSPDKTINYVTAHDNNTLHDKLYLSLVRDNRLNLLEKMSKQAHGLILTSQGISFIHAGDEFLRSKEISEGEFDNNSYQSTDEINQIRWDLKETNNDHYKYFQKLLDIRNEYSAFRLTTQQEINENVRFLFTDVNGLLGYFISSGNESFLVILNSTNKTYKLEFKDKKINVLIDTDNYEGVYEGKIKPYSFQILSSTEQLLLTDIPKPAEDGNLLLIVVISVSVTVVLAGAAIALYLIYKKRIVV